MAADFDDIDGSKIVDPGGKWQLLILNSERLNQAKDFKNTGKRQELQESAGLNHQNSEIGVVISIFFV